MASLTCSWSFRKSFQFFTQYNVGHGVVIYGLYCVEICPSITTLLTVFIINVYWILSNFFPYLLRCLWLLFLILFGYVTLIDLCFVEPSLHPWNKFHLIIVLMYCWIWSAGIFLRVLHLCSSGYFSPCSIFVWFWYHGNAGLMKRVWKCSFLFGFGEEFEKDWCWYFKHW